ncbi:hypothetical protein [Rhizorhabdus wittichii]|uniref:hypothetical protein n=1 Tax=Rhizorhabdus wittichii TaxID=160791 RepID=UPI00030E2DA1|nr:hypothetical protein [Rhizorhabdus wittichii]
MVTDRRRSGTIPGPHEPHRWDSKYMSAWQAIERGDATSDQQQLILEWMVGATGLNDLSYRPGDMHATAFAEGMRFVGLQFKKMLLLNPSAFTKEG